MAKLTLLALTFTALVAFATAHTTILTTTVEDDNPFPIPSFIPPIPSFVPPIPGVTGPLCRLKLQMQQLDKCRMHLQQDQSPYELNHGQSQQGQRQLQQQCCQQLQNVERRCQCEAVKQVLEDAQRSVQGQFGSQQQLEQKAQDLPQQCRLQIRPEECQISRGGSSGSQQCSRIQGQRFNQCQRFVQQAQQVSGSPRMMISRQSQQLQQQLQQCCNELENVQRDCQCEALEQVHRQAIQQQQGGQQQQQPWQQGGQQQYQPWQQGGQQQYQPWQQGGQHQQPWQQGGKQQYQPWQQGGQQQQPWQQPQWQQGSQQIGRAIDTIRNQCNLQVQQCRIPSAMF